MISVPRAVPHGRRTPCLLAGWSLIAGLQNRNARFDSSVPRLWKWLCSTVSRVVEPNPPRNARTKPPHGSAGIRPGSRSSVPTTVPSGRSPGPGERRLGQPSGEDRYTVNLHVALLRYRLRPWWATIGHGTGRYEGVWHARSHAALQAKCRRWIARDMLRRGQTGEPTITFWGPS